MEKHVIWSSEIDIKDWENELKDENPELDRNGIYELASELNWEYLEDEKANLSVQIPGGILVIADLGFWDGRRGGIKELEAPSTIADCLSFETDCEDAEWYVAEDGELRSTQWHHDGHHYLRYMGWKSKLSRKAKDKFIELFKSGWATDNDFKKYTLPLGPKVAKVYGWNLKGETK